MNYQREYGGIIWTNHALTRLSERQISQDKAWSTYRTPDHVYERKKDALAYKKKVGDKTITLIVTENEENEIIVISVWIDPPLAGTKDYKNRERYKKYKRSSFLGKIILSIRSQLGL